MNTRDLTVQELLDAGILDRYHRMTLSDCEDHGSVKKVKAYMQNLRSVLQQGIGIVFYSEEPAQKSVFANLIAMSALACGNSTRVISLNGLCSYMNPNTFGDVRTDDYTFSQIIQVDFLVIDDLCDGLPSNGFKTSCLYDVLKYRIASQKPVIATTRLSREGSNSFGTYFNAEIADMLSKSCNYIECVQSSDVLIRKRQKEVSKCLQATL